MLYKVVLTFESVDHILSVTILMKATEQYFVYGVYCAEVFSVLMKFSSVIIQMRAIEKYFGNGVYCDVQGGSNF